MKTTQTTIIVASVCVVQIVAAATFMFVTFSVVLPAMREEFAALVQVTLRLFDLVHVVSSVAARGEFIDQLWALSGEPVVQRWIIFANILGILVALLVHQILSYRASVGM